MVEATKHNFKDAFNNLQYEIRNCSFMSIDCEFTSLPSDGHFEHSFFDSGEERFNNIRNHLDQAVILQVGITPFKYSRDLNLFSANPYKFYIFPRVFGPFNVSFLFKATTIQFLTDHKFDFNKGFYDGISFLNRTKKDLILHYLYNDKLLSCLEENLNQEESNEILRVCEVVNKWKGTVSDHATMDFLVDPYNCAFNYLLQERIRLFNKDLWTHHEHDKIVVKKVTKEERSKLDEMEKNPEVKEKFIDSLLGFSRVYEMLANSKKPLVGHNLYLDLLIMYHQFYEDLPDSYSKFKSNLNELFPLVYDTKFLSYQLQRITKEKKYSNNSLGSLFELFQDTSTMFYPPYIRLDPKNIYSDASEQKKHDAGWDSYMTGFAFLKLAQQFAQAKKKMKHTDNLTYIELMTGIQEWKNRINIARAKISHLNLEGKDPPSTRPPLLHVQSSGNTMLTKLELDAIFKKYEPVHKKLISSSSALIAVPNYTNFKSILSDFDNSELLRVEKYSLVRHNSTIRACYVAVIVVPLVLAAWAGYKSR